MERLSSNTSVVTSQKVPLWYLMVGAHIPLSSGKYTVSFLFPPWNISWLPLFQCYLPGRAIGIRQLRELLFTVEDVDCSCGKNHGEVSAA